MLIKQDTNRIVILFANVTTIKNNLFLATPTPLPQKKVFKKL